MIDMVGYFGSFLVAVSLTMTNVWRLRWINLGGALLFTAYGALLRAWPVCAMNGAIVLIDLWYIVDMMRAQQVFAAQDVTEGDGRLLARFVAHYRHDITKFFPTFNFDRTRAEGARFFFILRNVVPVGLFVYHPCREGRSEIVLDYVIPDYRDFKNAFFLYSAQALLKLGGCRVFVTRTRVRAHATYLLRVGFRRVAGEPDLFEKAIDAA